LAHKAFLDLNAVRLTPSADEAAAAGGHRHKAVPTPRNGIIDGFRGLSVLCVIFGHLLQYRFALLVLPYRELFADNWTITAFAYSSLLRIGFHLQNLGVDLFFVISGYLITYLLLREEDQRGSISISAFYVRRVFRIFPAFYLYLATLFVLREIYEPPLPAAAIVNSGTFLCDVDDLCPWWLVTHTWSLAVEEQFYLVWPLAFLILGKERRSVALLLTATALFLLGFTHPMAWRFLCIACGCVYAASAAVRKVVAPLLSSWGVAVAICVALFSSLAASITPLFVALMAVRPVVVAIVFFGTLNEGGPLLRLVKAEWLGLVGIASYSVYLWQELSTGAPESQHFISALPILFVVPAALSYFLIERPLITVGHKLSARIYRAGK
jgi:peptidoglycan/LPS O-acetylase OafA/YrhL